MAEVTQRQLETLRNDPMILKGFAMLILAASLALLFA